MYFLLLNFLSIFLITASDFPTFSPGEYTLKVDILSQNISRVPLTKKHFYELRQAANVLHPSEPDLLVIIFQERFTNYTLTKKTKWEFASSSDYKPNAIFEGYTLISEGGLIQTDIFIFTKNNFPFTISSIQKAVKYDKSFGRLLSQKGVISITFTLNNSLILQFIGAHLLPEISGFYDRALKQEEIFSSLISPNPSHLTFYVGDLNYKLDMDLPNFNSEKDLTAHYNHLKENEELERENTKKLKDLIPELNKNNEELKPKNFRNLYKQVSKYEQLKYAMDHNIAFAGFFEEEPAFQFTYKIQKKFDFYDISFRTPCYADRALTLYRSNTVKENVEEDVYDAFKTGIQTDHLALMKSYKIKVNKFFEGEKVKKLLKENKLKLKFECLNSIYKKFYNFKLKIWSFKREHNYKTIYQGNTLYEGKSEIKLDFRDRDNVEDWFNLNMSCIEFLVELEVYDGNDGSEGIAKFEGIVKIFIYEDALKNGHLAGKKVESNFWDRENGKLVGKFFIEIENEDLDKVKNTNAKTKVFIFVFIVIVIAGLGLSATYFGAKAWFASRFDRRVRVYKSQTRTI